MVVEGERMLGGGTSAVLVTLAGVEVEELVSATDDKLELVAAVHPSAFNGDVTIVSDTGSVVTNQGAWTYLSPGQISSVAPNYGQLNTKVEISGTDLLGDGSGLTSVTLAGVEAEIVDATADSVKLVVRDSADTGPGDIVMTAGTGGRVTSTDGWTYKQKGVVLTVSPSSGREGTEVSIYGLSLFGHGSTIETVTLAGISATIVDQTDLYVIVTTPAADAADGAIEITSDTGATITSADAWSFIGAAEITSVTPAVGQVGTVIEIEGINMLGGAESLK